MDARRYIEERSIPEPMSGCWMWLASLGSHGYGVAPAPYLTAHRMSKAAFGGPVPAGSVVMHSCDMPWCVNPDHLTVGTHKQNTADMIRKGRSRFRTPGFRSHQRRLSDEQAIEILRSAEPTKRLARVYGVDHNVVRSIRQRKTYRDVAAPLTASPSAIWRPFR